MKIVSIIVFYNPTKEQIQNTERIARFCNVIVVDNSTTSLKDPMGFVYISNGCNVGIASAQNKAIRMAKELGASRILFLDQDSVIDEDSIIGLNKELDTVKSVDVRAVAIGPLVINKQTGEAYKNSLGGGTRKAVPSIISSGMLVDMSAFDEVGLMEEDLFIDVVDHEWCWRCNAKGFRVYMTSVVVMNHEVGNGYQMFLGMQFIWSSPFRYFYKYRNSLWMMPRSYVPNKWKIRTILRLSLDYMIFAIMGVVKKDKREYFKNATEGIIAGLKNDNKNEKNFIIC